ncbi:MAG: M48 family metallopeptidase [Myxococcota bacterium]
MMYPAGGCTTNRNSPPRGEVWMNWERATSLLTGLTLCGLACTKVPYTDRLQMTLVPKKTMHAMGAQAYADTLATATVVKGTEDARLVKAVGRSIAAVANEPDFAWTFNLLNDDQVNAWCLPGGYIAFYSGILPALKNEAGLAFVMGHEVGHATARHGAERVSQQVAMLGGLTVLDALLSGSDQVSDETRALTMGAIGLGAEVGVLLPFSRRHEAEADTIGLFYMADAGYPPAESVRVWERMEAMGGASGPAFLSTHPTNDRRIDNLKDWMPEAKKRYKRNKRDYDTRVARW